MTQPLVARQARPTMVAFQLFFAAMASWTATLAIACPFCGTVGQSLSQRRDEASVVAVAEAESGASADATGFLSQRFRLDQLLRGNADAAVVGASVPARVVGPLAGTAAEPKASAPPLGSNKARKPQEEAAAPAARSSADSIRTEKAERELLQGTWSLVEQKSNGESVPNEFKRYDLTFTGNRAVIEWARELSDDLPGSAGALKGAANSCWATLNVSSSPKELNFVGENFLMQAVYDCTGDTLTIAFFGRSEVARPNSLVSSKTSRPINTSHIRWLLKRKTTADNSGNDASHSDSFSWDSVGIRLQPCDPLALEAVTGATPPLKGAVAVAEVRPNSPASAAGVRVGDLLVALDKWATNDLDELKIVVGKPEVAVNGRVKFSTVRNGGIQSGYFDLPTP